MSRQMKLIITMVLIVFGITALTGCGKKAKEEAAKAKAEATAAKAEAEVAAKNAQAAEASAVAAKEEAQAANKQVATLEGTLNETKTALKKANDQVAKVSGLLTATEKQKATLETQAAQADKLKADMANLSKSLDAVKAELAQVKRAKDALERKVTQLSQERDAAAAKAAELEAANKKLIEELEVFKAEAQAKAKVALEKASLAKAKTKEATKLSATTTASPKAMEANLAESQAGDPELGIELDVTWVSKYIWRGIDILDDKGAIQPSLTFDLYDTGFSFNVWASYADSSKRGSSVSAVDATEYDYAITYSNSFNDEAASQVDYSVSWVYYDFIDTASKNADAQEINASISMPNLCPFGVVPSYTIVKMWPAKSSAPSREISGWIHVLGLGYEMECPATGLPLSLSWDLTYNDGAGAVADVDNDWSHTTFGVSTAMDAPFGGTFSPALYYQISFDDSVNDENEVWAGLSYTKAF